MPAHKVAFGDRSLTADMVLAEMHVPGKEAYRDVIEEILFRSRKHLKPQALWRKVNVSWAGDNSVRLGEFMMHDPYLAKRLSNVHTAYVFLSKVSDELFTDRLKMQDAVEKYLFDFIMRASLNQAFSAIAAEISSMLPYHQKIYMDNPGIQDCWDLSYQKALLEILQEGSPLGEEAILLTEQGYFINEYSFMGIIYARSRAQKAASVLPEERRKGDIHYNSRKNTLTPTELMQILYTSAGLG